MKPVYAIGVLMLAGCADPHEPLSPDFGNAVSTNIAAQVVNPTPQDTSPLTTDGHHVANALERYQTDKVYRPRLPLESGRINAPEPPPER